MHLRNATRPILKELAFLLFRPRRVLFNHLPKCAGTTVTQYLRLHFPDRVVFQCDGYRPARSVTAFQALPQSARHGYHLVAGHLAHQLLDHVHPATLTLTILRDPVDRIISHYYYVRQNKAHYLHDRVVKSGIQLEDFAAGNLSVELRNWYTTHFTGLSIQDAEKNPAESVQLAVNCIQEKYDIVGFQDNLVGVVEQLRQRGRLRLPFANEPHNKTIDRAGVNDVPEHVRKTIADVNFLDIQLYARLRAAPVSPLPDSAATTAEDLTQHTSQTADH